MSCCLHNISWKEIYKASDKTCCHVENSNILVVCCVQSILGKTSKKIKCIFYDIVLKGRGVKDQNQISEKIWNYDKGFKGGRWKNLMSQIHLSNILFIMCIKQQYSHINVKIIYSFQVMTFIVHFFYSNLSLCNN